MARQTKSRQDVIEFRKESLIAAAIRVVARNGIENTTIAKICTAAGVSRGLSWHYFRDKEDLLCQAYQYLQTEHLRRGMEASANAEGGALERLKSVVEVNFRPMPNNRDYSAAYVAFWNLSISNAKIKRITTESYRGFHSHVKLLLKEAVEEAGVDIDLAEATLSFIGLIDGLWLEMSIGVDSVNPKSASAALFKFLKTILAGERLSSSHR